MGLIEKWRLAREDPNAYGELTCRYWGSRPSGMHRAQTGWWLSPRQWYFGLLIDKDEDGDLLGSLHVGPFYYCVSILRRGA